MSGGEPGGVPDQRAAVVLRIEHANGARGHVAQRLEQLEAAGVPAEIIVHQRRIPGPPPHGGECLVERRDGAALEGRLEGSRQRPAPPGIVIHDQDAALHGDQRSNRPVGRAPLEGAAAAE